MTSHHLFKAVWYWKDDHLAYQSLDEAKERAKQSTRSTQEFSFDTAIKFLENVDQNCQKHYKQNYQRTVKPNVPIVVTIQDIKDVVTYLLIGRLPQKVMSLFHSHEINPLLRALIAYMQLYLQVWDDLSYRRSMYNTQMHLKHPMSVERETRCRENLSKLRCRIGQEYAMLLAGEGSFKKYHHMNNAISRSYVSRDMALYDYVFKLVPRAVWIALGRRNYKEIDSELARLFRAPNLIDSSSRRSPTAAAKATLLSARVAELTDEDDLRVLQEDRERSVARSKWRQRSPAIEAVFVHEDDPEFFLARKLDSPGFECTRLSGMDAAMTLPEELLQRFGITVGVLGLPRENFEAMLHPKQEARKSLEEEELERMTTSIVAHAEKPKIKMYEFLKQLEDYVDLTGVDEDGKAIKEKISAYLKNHVEDSKNSFNLWKSLKCFFIVN